MDDYREDPRLDHYDPELLDDGPHEPMSMQARLAAEREMAERDRRSPSPSPPATPAINKRLNETLQASPSSAGDSEGTSSRKKPRFSAGVDEDEEEDVRLGRCMKMSKTMDKRTFFFGG